MHNHCAGGGVGGGKGRGGGAKRNAVSENCRKKESPSCCGGGGSRINRWAKNAEGIWASDRWMTHRKGEAGRYDGKFKRALRPASRSLFRAEEFSTKEEVRGRTSSTDLERKKGV